MNQAVCQFVSARGNNVQVFKVRVMAAQRVNGFAGFSGVSAVFAMVNDQRVDCDAGCAFQAASRVHAAGF